MRFFKILFLILTFNLLCQNSYSDIDIDAKHIIFCYFEYLEQIPKMRESIDKAKDKKNAIFGENTNIHVLDQYEHLYINIDE